MDIPGDANALGAAEWYDVSVLHALPASEMAGDLVQC